MVFPSGREVKGTEVGETRPIVCQVELAFAAHTVFLRNPCPEWSKYPRGWRGTACCGIEELSALGDNIVTVTIVKTPGHAASSLHGDINDLIVEKPGDFLLSALRQEII